MPQLQNKIDAFEVREIPQFMPCGNGAFTWFLIEKVNLHTDSVAQTLAQLCKLKPHQISYAGKKDKIAKTSQWFSVPGEHQLELSVQRELGNGQWSILERTLHDHPLRLGQLQANAFILQLEEAAELDDALTKISQKTLINYFGPQRFGQQNVQVIHEWIAGHYQACVDLLLADAGASGILKGLRKSARRFSDPQKILQASGKRFLQFYASVAQSLVFNAVAEARVDAGLARTARVGDLLLRNGKSAFHVRADELDILQEELNRDQVWCSAPLPGFKVRQAREGIDREEQGWSQPSGVPWSVFERGHIFASPGERRSLLLRFIEQPQWDGSSKQLRFSLPSGSYASVVMDYLDVSDPRR